MNGDTLDRIRQASPAIRDRWEELLRAAPPTLPVSNPDAMVPRIPESIAQIIRSLSWASVGRASRRRQRALRRCVHNPFRTYFHAGEQALLEAIAPPAAPDSPPATPTPDSPPALHDAACVSAAGAAVCDPASGAADPAATLCASMPPAPIGATGDVGADTNAATPSSASDVRAISRAVETLAAADVDAFCAVCRKYRLVAVCRCGRWT